MSTARLVFKQEQWRVRLSLLSFRWQGVSSVLLTSRFVSCIVTCSQQREPSSRPTNRLSASLFLQSAGWSSTHKLKV